MQVVVVLHDSAELFYKYCMNAVKNMYCMMYTSNVKFQRILVYPVCFWCVYFYEAVIA